MLGLGGSFPNLSLPPTKTSDRTPTYNCIAWAFGENRKKWWPNTRGFYWPLEATGLNDIDAFMALFAERGWAKTNDRALQFGLEKVALYALNGKPKHAARQLSTGTWTSKLGDEIDICHALEELEGPLYGTVTQVFAKPR